MEQVPADRSVAFMQQFLSCIGCFVSKRYNLCWAQPEFVKLCATSVIYIPKSAAVSLSEACKAVVDFVACVICKNISVVRCELSHRQLRKLIAHSHLKTCLSAQNQLFPQTFRSNQQLSNKQTNQPTTLHSTSMLCRSMFSCGSGGMMRRGWCGSRSSASCPGPSCR